MSKSTVCSIDGCGKPVRARGWCAMHYERWRLHGDPHFHVERIAAGSRKSTVNAEGYLVRKTADGRLQYEHIIVAERALGRQLRPPEEVHHFDENKANNANGNLVICPDRAYHLLLHRRTAALEACGNPDWRKCPYCQTWDDPDAMYRMPGTDSYRHRACHAAREKKRLAA